MKSCDGQVSIRSTSGGGFSELAQIILEEQGCVAGAAYRKDFSVEHQIIERMSELDTVRRSKYQQSEIGLLYRRIKEKLLRGRSVLFCGTPCQAAGLRAFLGEEVAGCPLYIVDFICRGVPSPELFQKYLHDLQKQYESKVVNVWMKNKRNGWHSLTTVIQFANGEEYVRGGFEDPYVQLYLKYNLGIRESCYQCRFKHETSAADITLGDFWGLEPGDMDDDKGTSVLLCRTKKGRELVDRLADRCRLQKKDMDDVKKANPCLVLPVARPVLDSERFYEILNMNGFKTAYEWAVNFFKVG